MAGGKRDDRRAGRPGPGETGARASAAPWAMLVLAAVATLGGVSPFGVVQPFDLSMAAAAVAATIAIVATSPSASRALRKATAARRIVAAASLVLVTTGISALGASDRWSALVGTPGSGLGAAQLATLLALGLGAAWLAPSARRVVETAAPWIAATQLLAASAQLSRGLPGIGTHSTATYLSMTLLLLIPPTVAPAVGERGVRRDAASVARLAIGLACAVVLALAGARVGAAVAAAGLVWMLLSALPRRAGGSARRKAGPRRDLLAIGVAAAGVLGAVAAVAVRLRSGSLDPLDLGTRPEMWRGALRVIEGSPLFGVGPDGFRNALAGVVDASLIVREGSAGSDFALVPTDPHDLVLAVLVSVGLAGAVALGWLAFETGRAWVAERRVTGAFSWPAVSAVLFVAAAILAPTTMQNLPLAAVVAGLSVPLGAPPLRDEARGSGRLGTAAGRTLSLACLAACALVLAVAGTRFAVGAVGRQDMASALRAQQAARIWRIDPFLHFGAAVRFRGVATAGDASALSPAVEEARAAVVLAPADPFYRTGYGAVLRDAGTAAAALEQYEAALRLFPNSPEAAIGAADTLLSLGRASDARRYAERAVAVAPAQASAHEVAAAVYAALGDTARAAEESARAIRLGGQ